MLFRRSSVVSGLLALFSWSLLACSPQPLTITKEPGAFRVVSAGSCGELATELIAAYEAAYPWVDAELVGTYNARLAQETLEQGGAEVALLSWLSDADDGISLWSREFGRAGIAVVAGRGAPFAEVSVAVLRELYRGRVQEWDGVELTVVSREQGAGVRMAFEATVLGKLDATLTSVVMPSEASVGKYLARASGALGYVSALGVPEGVRLLPVDGALPEREAVSNGRYPLTHPLIVGTVGEPEGGAREFVQWLLGPEGEAIVNEQGATFIPP